MGWLRRSFLTGLVVTVPLFITVVTLVWTFRFIDGAARPVAEFWLGREVPGLGVLITAAVILLVGVVATNVIGRRILQRADVLLKGGPDAVLLHGPPHPCRSAWVG